MTSEVNPMRQSYDLEQGTIVGDGIRPWYISDFIGQHQLKENLTIFLGAAKKRRESLEHVLLYGPPGLGKTTLSYVIANEMAVNIKTTTGPVLSKAGDLAAILTSLQEGDVLFIDEIHRLNRAVEELLYSAMEDFYIDLIIGDGPAARTLRMKLPRFTLIGATTRLGLLTNPLKDRFGIPLKLRFYEDHELQVIVVTAATKLAFAIDEEAAAIIAQRARGTPRVAIRLLRRVRDFAIISNMEGIVGQSFVLQALRRLSVDDNGLDELDLVYLRYIMEAHRGGPVGIDTIAAGISEDAKTIEDFIEPYLLRLGFLERSSRGRILTAKCREYVDAAAN